MVGSASRYQYRCRNKQMGRSWALRKENPEEQKLAQGTIIWRLYMQICLIFKIQIINFWIIILSALYTTSEMYAPKVGTSFLMDSVCLPSIYFKKYCIVCLSGRDHNPSLLRYFKTRTPYQRVTRRFLAQQLLKYFPDYRLQVFLPWIFSSRVPSKLS